MTTFFLRLADVLYVLAELLLCASLLTLALAFWDGPRRLAVRLCWLTAAALLLCTTSGSIGVCFSMNITYSTIGLLLGIVGIIPVNIVFFVITDEWKALGWLLIQIAVGCFMYGLSRGLKTERAKV